MRKLFALLFLCLFAFSGFFFGHKLAQGKIGAAPSLEKEFPLVEKKSFVFLIYAHNQAKWCERSLRSVFEQDYDHYRVVFIDDASTDKTMAVAQEYVQETNQSGRTQFIRYDTRIGVAEANAQVMGTLLDKEIAIPLHAKDWLASTGGLTRINALYQNPDVWAVSAPGLAYPVYEESLQGLKTFYAVLGKRRTGAEEVGGHLRTLLEPLVLINETCANAKLYEQLH